jgi:hypothetical protein
MLCPRAPKQAQNIGAAAKNDVLAVVDDFINARMEIGGRTAAHIGPPLEQFYSVAILRQCARRSQSGNAAANYRDAIWIS